MEVELKFRLLITITLISCLGLLINAHNFKRENQGVSFAKFVKASSVKLKVFKLATLNVSKVGECSLECINNKKCYSVNFRVLPIDGKHVCQLLRIDKFTKADQLVASSDFDHYYIKVS